MSSDRDSRHHRGLESAAVLLLLFGAMLDPAFTVAVAGALLAGAYILYRLEARGRNLGR